ncbi:hypothetical protein [Elizabethkingia anophelis]|uniref:hypothetical protein n=1 Tax=Elizabethkingia anophelis TaxID=1117645 RepID=UPI0008406812|nr:hypothetical protein [Elizabethkingia anophelis]OCW71882.1 hypothetical protein A4G24_17645 [Elizabethkingia anophelis]
MRRFTYLLFITIVISCQKNEISNLEISELTTKQINFLPEIRHEIENSAKQTIEVLYEKENDKHLKEIGIPKLKRVIIGGGKNNLNKEEFFKKNNRQYEDNKSQIEQNILKQPKYGLRYSFTITNYSKQTIEQTSIKTTIKLIYDHDLVILQNHFQNKKNIKPNDSIKISKNLIFNYIDGYNPKLFTIHKPKQILLEIYGQSFNSVGFKKNFTEKMDITQKLKFSYDDNK